MKILLPNGCSCSQLKVFPSNWNTKKALYYGAVAVVGISALVYCHKKNNAAQKNNNKLSNINLSLIQERDSLDNSIKQLNQEISKQAIVIKSYIFKGYHQEKKQRKKDKKSFFIQVKSPV